VGAAPQPARLRWLRNSDLTAFRFLIIFSFFHAFRSPALSESETRERRKSRTIAPGFHFVQSGLLSSVRGNAEPDREGAGDPPLASSDEGRGLKEECEWRSGE